MGRRTFWTGGSRAFRACRACRPAGGGGARRARLRPAERRLRECDGVELHAATMRTASAVFPPASPSTPPRRSPAATPGTSTPTSASSAPATSAAAASTTSPSTPPRWAATGSTSAPVASATSTGSTTPPAATGPPTPAASPAPPTSPLNSGTLTLADPGQLATSGDTGSSPFNQSSNATLFRVSNGVGAGAQPDLHLERQRAQQLVRGGRPPGRGERHDHRLQRLRVPGQSEPHAEQRRALRHRQLHFAVRQRRHRRRRRRAVRPGRRQRYGGLLLHVAVPVRALRHRLPRRGGHSAIWPNRAPASPAPVRSTSRSRPARAAA